MSNTTAKAKFGRRLLPHVIDDLASKRADEECFAIPRTANPRDGWKSITFRAYATAINFLSHRIVEKCGYPEPDTFPALAYIGPNDARYVAFCLAAMKTGYKALFISPRNSHEAQMSLFEATGCRIICFPDSHRAVVAPWLEQRVMRIMVVDSLEECFASRDVPHFPYDKTFEEAEWTPAVVLHTSGSTGHPKPFIAMHGLLAAFDAYHDFPDWNGCRTFNQVWSETPGRLFAPFPLFHAGGLYLFMCRAIYWANPVAFGIANRPLSPDLVVECLKYAEVETALIPPVILEYMSQSPSGIQSLLPLKMVFFGGGELATPAGNELVKHGVTLVNSYAATEFSPFTNYVVKDPELWQYFLIDSNIIGIDWRPLDGYDDVYRLVFARQSRHPGLQTCFYALPNEQEMDTKDLFKRHPSLPDHWLYYGRADNIIVLSNGEKLNPVKSECMIERHPLVKGALVVGSGRFQTALLIEPATPLASREQAKDLIESVWPTIVRANEETAAHSRLAKDFITITSPQKPLPRGGKGTIQRANAVKLYEEEINRLYAAAGKYEAGAVTYHMDMTSEQSFTESVQEAFETNLAPGVKLELDTDFYTAGIDSLQVINLCRQLKSGLGAAGLHDVAALVTIGTIYQQQTLRRLGSYLYSRGVQNDRSVPVQDDKSETQAMELIWRKYTESLPKPNPGRSAAVSQGQTVILTGSTGMLGSYMLARLLSDPQVVHVYCLNRGHGGGAKQQEKSMMARGLSVDFSKCTFYTANMSQENFGLGHKTYDNLLREVDRIFLVAWPVNFNLPFESFEPHIRGVRNVADFASRASKRVEVIFISTIDTCSGWNAAEGPVPETRIEDLSLPSTGYGRSKLVASLVLEDVANACDFPATVIRVGQIAGSESEAHVGAWNRHEWIPSIIASSLYLRALPGDLAQKNRIDWMPTDKMVSLIFEVAGTSGYFHGVNPTTTTWTELVPAIQEFYGKDNIAEVISFQDWVARLEGSADDEFRSLDKNPSLKLLDLSRAIAANTNARGDNAVVFSTTKTAEISRAVRTATAITPQSMVHWCKQWEF
ncbi:hypothetical protein F5Y01DRAFT_324112 [Xylaria sp. FL0043]|nr:hypothetical protein F5Y01DRAFT_324112 [Xylaria sp. FL0043]